MPACAGANEGRTYQSTAAKMNAHARKRWACRLKNLALALDPFEFALAPTVCSVGVAVDVASELFLGRLADVAPNPPVSVSVLRELPKTDIAFERREVIPKLRVRQGRRVQMTEDVTDE